eukprot:g26623.t1
METERSRKERELSEMVQVNLGLGVKAIGKVDELFKLLVGARGSANTVINVAEEEVGDRATVAVEEGLFHVPYEEAGIAWAHAELGAGVELVVSISSVVIGSSDSGVGSGILCDGTGSGNSSSVVGGSRNDE